MAVWWCEQSPDPFIKLIRKIVSYGSGGDSVVPTVIVVMIALLLMIIVAFMNVNITFIQLFHNFIP